MVSTAMNVVATAHLAVNCYRYLFAFRGDFTGDALEYALTIVTAWHRSMKETLFLIQELLGSSVGVRIQFVVPSFDSHTYLYLHSSIVRGLCGIGTTRLCYSPSSYYLLKPVSNLQ